LLVSVIIPVYNGERYVRQAVESAVVQPETGEVLLIEDGSRDSSLQVCEQLADEYHPQVHLLRHADHGNHGQGASRNLGIRQSRCDYVAFLDDDDYFLPGRFSVAGELFAGDPDLDGVYEAIGIEYEDKASELRWLAMGGPVGLTMTERVAPDCLFEKHGPIGPCGRCGTAGWVVRRSIFSRTGLFDEHLRLYEDIVLLAKFAAVGKMLPGRLDEPVAIRRIHPTNYSCQPKPPFQDYRARLEMWAALWRWGKRNLSPQRRGLVLEHFVDRARRPYRDPDTFVGRQLLPRLQLTGLALFYPDIVLEKPFWLHYVRMMLPSFLRRRLLRS